MKSVLVEYVKEVVKDLFEDTEMRFLPLLKGESIGKRYSSIVEEILLSHGFSNFDIKKQVKKSVHHHIRIAVNHKDASKVNDPVEKRKISYEIGRKIANKISAEIEDATVNSIEPDVDVIFNPSPNSFSDSYPAYVINIDFPSKKLRETVPIVFGWKDYPIGLRSGGRVYEKQIANYFGVSPNGNSALPDVTLPRSGIMIEVKGEMPRWGQPTLYINSKTGLYNHSTNSMWTSISRILDALNGNLQIRRFGLEHIGLPEETINNILYPQPAENLQSQIVENSLLQRGIPTSKSISIPFDMESICLYYVEKGATLIQIKNHGLYFLKDLPKILQGLPISSFLDSTKNVDPKISVSVIDKALRSDIYLNTSKITNSGFNLDNQNNLQDFKRALGI